MRNIFDQYSMPENRLSHALACVLEHDRELLRPFLAWLGCPPPGDRTRLVVTQQRLPGEFDPTGVDDAERKGLPDICVHDGDEQWVVLIESKVGMEASSDQLIRHERTLKRRGFERPAVVLITVNAPPASVQRHVKAVRWRDVYEWFVSKASASFWARQFIQYMEVFESKMIADEYQIKGTITKFTGLGFDENNPYTYPQAKRLLGLLRDELLARADLHEIGADSKGEGRSAITGSRAEIVWDYIPLKQARGAYFTAFPHLTIAIGRTSATASITVPNGVRGGLRRRLLAVGVDGFVEMIRGIEKQLRPVTAASRGAKPMIYALQRHYPSQRSHPVTDGELRADLRTAVRQNGARTKFQPEWITCVYELLVNKGSNIQLGLSVQFDYACPKVRSREVVDLYAKAWIAMSPMIDFVLDGKS